MLFKTNYKRKINTKYRVSKGIVGIWDFTKKNSAGFGVDCFQEAGFAKIGHGMQHIDMKGKWDAGFL